jgi:glycosyltransferase involved in cell wall biosynthesis
MEAMARGRIVLAPAITGIPELVIPGKTGFLYQSGQLEDFVQRVLLLQTLMRDIGHEPGNRLDWIRLAARVYVRNNFSRETNLTQFGYLFPRLAAPGDWSVVHENSVLQ